MNRFKDGDWIKHPKHGVGRINNACSDGSISMVYFNGGISFLFLDLDSDRDGIEEEIQSIKRAKPSFDDFDSLFTEVEETPKFKVGDIIRTKWSLTCDTFIVREGVIFRIEKVLNEELSGRLRVKVMHACEKITATLYINSTDIELWEED